MSGTGPSSLAGDGTGPAGSEASSPSQPSKRQKGRPADPINDYFEVVGTATGKRNTVKCRTCPWTGQNRVELMRNHVYADQGGCRGLTTQQKDAARRDSLQYRKVDMADFGKAHKPAMSRQEAKRQSTLEHAGFRQRMPDGQGMQADRFLGRWVYTSGVAFNAVDSPFFLQFCQSLHPGWSGP